jgi:parvulin-like peptidyl-prolyl isomerase
VIVPFSPRSPLPLLAGLLTLAGVLAIGGCGSESEPGSAPEWRPYALGDSLSDTTYAVVVQSPYGTDTLRADAYRQRVAALSRAAEASDPPPDTTLHRTAVRQFVGRHVMVGAAHRRGVEVDSGRLADRMERIRGEYESEAAFRQALAEQGLTPDSVRRREADDLRLEAFWETLAERAEVPTNAEIDEYRREYRREEVRLRYIFFRVDPQAAPQRRDSVRALAEAVLDSIRGGASFAAMARRHSDSPTAMVGGRTPRYKPEGQFTGALGEALSTLQDTGDVVREPVRAEDGTYIVRLEDRRSPRMSRGEARWKLLSQRRRDSVEAAQRALMAEAVVRVNPDVVFLHPDER